MTFRESEIPCFECKERHIGCHGKCDRYASYVFEKEELKKKIFQVKENNTFAIENARRRAKRVGKNIKNNGF